MGGKREIQVAVTAKRKSIRKTVALFVRKFNDRWLIVHDHTSRLKD